MKLICDDCGDLGYALVDGYSFGDRLLEGVMFAVTLKGKKYTAKPKSDAEDEYLDDLNKKKWLKAAADYAKETDFLTCPKCNYEVVNPLYDEENDSAAIIVPMVNPVDLFGLKKKDK